MNANIAAATKDLILVQNFHLEMEAGKTVISLELIWPHQCMLIINILILGEKLTQWLDDTTLTTKDKYLTNFTKLRKTFVLNLHYDWNATKISIQSKKLWNKRLYTVLS